MSSPLQARFDTFLTTLGPTPDQLKIAKTELDFLESKLADYMEESDEFTFLKALRSGSYAKNTLLRRHETGDFDADMGIYVEAEEETAARDLLDYVEKLLRRAYAKRTKRRPKFDRSSKSAVRVIFEETPKINIDAVPIISLDHASIPNWGAIPRRDGEFRKTSVTEHVEFVRKRNRAERSTSFNKLVMLFKWWRDHRLDEPTRSSLSSFALELIVGKAFDETEKNHQDEWLNDILEIGQWILRHRFTSTIRFPDPRVAAASSPCTDAVRVIDPVNAENNVTHAWTEVTAEAFLDGIAELCDVVSDARLEAEVDEIADACQFLDQVFDRFSRWSVE